MEEDVYATLDYGDPVEEADGEAESDWRSLVLSVEQLRNVLLWQLPNPNQLNYSQEQQLQQQQPQLEQLVNDSFSVNVSNTAATSWPASEMPPTPPPASFDANNYWALLALVLVFGTAAGNILVCLAIAWERRLQNVTNYFLMSLAITDLMVAVLVMPLGILTLVKGELTDFKIIRTGYRYPRSSRESIGKRCRDLKFF